MGGDTDDNDHDFAIVNLSTWECFSAWILLCTEYWSNCCPWLSVAGWRRTGEIENEALEGLIELDFYLQNEGSGRGVERKRWSKLSTGPPLGRKGPVGMAIEPTFPNFQFSYQIFSTHGFFSLMENGSRASDSSFVVFIVMVVIWVIGKDIQWGNWWSNWSLLF